MPPFPTPIPADGATYAEDGKPFFVHQGKWKERPGCRFFISEPKGSANSVPLSLDERDESTRRIIFQATFMYAGGNGHLQFSVKSKGAWLPASGGWDGVGADLSDGTNSWRKGSGQWSTIRSPNSYGIYLNWAEGTGWQLGNGERAFCRIEIQQLNDTWSIFQWRLMHMKENDRPCRVVGIGKMKALPKDIEIIRLHTDAYFNPTTMVAESF